MSNFLYVGKQHVISKKVGLNERQHGLYLLLNCTGTWQGSPRNLLGFRGAVGDSLFTAISHGRIGDVVQTNHTLGTETVQWRHSYVA